MNKCICTPGILKLYDGRKESYGIFHNSGCPAATSRGLWFDVSIPFDKCKHDKIARDCNICFQELLSKLKL